MAKPKLGKLEPAKPRKSLQTPANPGKCAISHAGEVATLQEAAGLDLDVQRQRTVGEVQAGGGRPGPEQGFASLDLMVFPSLKNDAKVNIENENRKLCQPSKLSKI